jgi:hypothetical protein
VYFIYISMVKPKFATETHQQCFHCGKVPVTMDIGFDIAALKKAAVTGILGYYWDCPTCNRTNYFNRQENKEHVKAFLRMAEKDKFRVDLDKLFKKLEDEVEPIMLIQLKDHIINTNETLMNLNHYMREKLELDQIIRMCVLTLMEEYYTAN